MQTHTSTSGNATLKLWGHGRVAAHLEVERYPLWAWMARVGVFLLIWIVGSVVTLVFTFDPFVASFPFMLGLGLVYRGIRGRYRVRSFAGACPRCSNQLELKPGSKINLPHRLDCFACHFEPELHLGLH
jgi:hypothetical protein